MTVVPIIINERGMRKHLQEYTPTEHDYQVLAMINDKIDEKYNGTLRNRGGSTIATVSYILERCQATQETRTISGDTIGRDAEYYFKSRWVVARHKWTLAKVGEAVWMDAQNLGYNAWKSLLFLVHRGQKLQTDSGAVTPPGGIFWGFKGALDGLQDNPDALMKPFSPTLPRPGFRSVPIA